MSRPRTRSGWSSLILLVVAALVLVSCDSPRQATATLPAPTAQVAVVAPSPAATSTPTNTPLPTATPTAANSPTPSPTPTPRPTPRPSPTPAGYYADESAGWSLLFPADWTLTETGDEFPTIVASDPGQSIFVLVGAQADPGEVSLAEFGTLLAEMIAAQGDELGEQLQTLDSEEFELEDGTPAYRVAVENEEQGRFEFILARRGGTVTVLVIVAHNRIWESRARTIQAIVDSLVVTSPRLYDVDRSTSLVLTGSEPSNMDPATTEFGASGYMGLVFSGLVALNTDLQVVPDLAQRWEISADGRTYTFHLRPNAVFHDGRPVTAADFKYSWERAADPKTGSVKTSVYLGDVVGVRDMLDGKADEISGVVVIDDHTLEVTIDEPKVYFLAKLTWPVAYVVDRENVEQRGADEWWREPVGTGPFRLSRIDDDVIIFARNDDYYGTPPGIENVVYLLNSGPSFQLYETGEVDMAGVPLDLIERVEDEGDPLHADLHTMPDLCTGRVILDNSRPPFDDPLVRRAFSYAVDRQKLADVVLKDAAVPAGGPLPPGMPGYSPEVTGYSFDPEQAVALIAESSYGTSGLPPITLTASGYNEPGSDEAALVAMWENTFGISITVELLDPFDFIVKVKEHHGEMFTLGWCADYPDPENFLDILYHSGSEENLAAYGNPDVDRLLEQARTERDPAARLALYLQAEQTIVADAAEIWLTYPISRLLLKPYVHGYRLTPIDVQQFQNVSLDDH